MVLLLLALTASLTAQTQQTSSQADVKAAEIVSRAVEKLGGSKYLGVKTQVGKGKFSILKDGFVASFQTFHDVIVFPDKERTDFKGGSSSRVTQANTGETGWVFDGDLEVVKVQTENQIADFKKGMRMSVDNLLRGGWKGDAELTYVGKRPASLGKRNDVLKLTYKDGFIVEFELSADDGTPQKSIHRRIDGDGKDVIEEDRYAQFVDIGGIKAPFIIDRFIDGKPFSRINFESIEYNKNIPESIFAKPASVKEAKKDIKL